MHFKWKKQGKSFLVRRSGTLGVRQEYTLVGTPVACSPCVHVDFILWGSPFPSGFLNGREFVVTCVFRPWPCLTSRFSDSPQHDLMTLSHSVHFQAQKIPGYSKKKKHFVFLIFLPSCLHGW